MDEDLPSLISQVESLGKLVLSGHPNDRNQATRRELQLAATKLSLAVEDPGELVDRILFSTLDNIFIKIAIDLDLFNILVKSNTPKSTEEFANITGADRTLLGRILRGLASIHVIEEVGEELYKVAKISRSFTGTKGVWGARFFHDALTPIWHQIPQFLASTHYQNPSDPLVAPIQAAYNFEGPCFKWFAEHPEILASFHRFMSAHREGRTHWLDFYPVEQRLGQGFHNEDNQAVMLIDIGGSHGKEIRELKRRYPNLPGRMILQDLEGTINQVISGMDGYEGMEAMAYDFFTEQPIKGARAYYFRSVFHDWPDWKCHEILSRCTKVMEPGYSKLLINDFAIADQGACSYATHSDFNMLATLAATERTVKQWHQLLNSAGLKIINIWTKEQESESIIEAMIMSNDAAC